MPATAIQYNPHAALLYVHTRGAHINWYPPQFACSIPLWLVPLVGRFAPPLLVPRCLHLTFDMHDLIDCVRSRSRLGCRFRKATSIFMSCSLSLLNSRVRVLREHPAVSNHVPLSSIHSSFAAYKVDSLVNFSCVVTMVTLVL